MMNLFLAQASPLPPVVIVNQASGFEDNEINFGIFAQPSASTQAIEVI